MADQQIRMALPQFSAKVYDPQQAKSFMDDFTNYCRLYNIADANKVDTLASALRDDARTWLQQHQHTATRVTWNNTKAAFLAYYTAPVPRVNRAQMVASCKQKSNEGVRAFLARCCCVAFETMDPPQADSRPVLHRTVGAGQAQQAIDVTIEDDEIKPIHAFYAQELAMNIFVAGCHENLRKQIALNKDWNTWAQLTTLAISVEETLAPAQISRQLQQYAGTSAVDAQPKDAEQSAVAQVASKKKQKPAAAQPNQPKRTPKGQPDPQQHRTHSHPVTCYWCGGQYHTERHCLAKQKKMAGRPAVAAATAAPPPPPQPTYAQATYAQATQPAQVAPPPQQFIQPVYADAQPPMTFAQPPGPVYQQTAIQPVQLPPATPFYPNPYFPNGE